MTCKTCGETKYSCKNKDFTNAVIEIDNPEQITLMRKVVIPASMGDDTTVPPVVGKYKNVLLFYEANHKSYLYSSDGIPTLLANGLTDYEEAVNLPQINGVTLTGDKTSAELGLQSALAAGDGIEIENDTISISDIEQYAHFFDTVADMKASTNLINGSYAQTLGYHTKDDGGKALYKIRTITNDDIVDECSIIELADDSLIAELITNEANLKVFGAYGDGSHNDSVAFAKTLDYAMNKEFDVYIPTGTYLLNPNVFQSVNRNSAYRNLVIKGDGGRQSILKLNNNTTSQYLSDSTSKELYAELHFYELGFTANDNTGNLFLCYSTGTEKRYYFHECFFSELNNILRCTGTGNADIHRFYDCQFTHIYGDVLTLDNQQCVGIELHGCQGDIYGGLLNAIEGGFVNFFGGIFDFFNGGVKNYVFDLSNSHMGVGNYGITCNGVRFELHGGQKLINATSHSNTAITFNDCNIGTVDALSSGVYYGTIYNSANIQFNNCTIDKNLTFYLETNISHNGRGALLRFNNCTSTDRIYKQIVANDNHCRVINEGEVCLADYGYFGSSDFDWNFMERNTTPVSAKTKTAILKPYGVGLPQASTSSSATFTLPPNSFVKRIKFYRPATPGAAGTYQLHVGNSDSSVIYGETEADALYSAGLDLDIKDLGFIADNTIKFWATGTSPNITTVGYAYVEYI